MPNPLIQRLGDRFRSVSDQYDVILSGADIENRDLYPSEDAELNQLRSDMEPLGTHLEDLCNDRDRKESVLRAMSGPTVPERSGAPRVHVRSEPEMYRPDNQGEMSLFVTCCTAPLTATTKAAAASTSTR